MKVTKSFTIYGKELKEMIGRRWPGLPADLTVSGNVDECGSLNAVTIKWRADEVICDVHPCGQSKD